jgi:hypothetical protein
LKGKKEVGKLTSGKTGRLITGITWKQNWWVGHQQLLSLLSPLLTGANGHFLPCDLTIL